ncbi:ATP-binding protein [Halomicroarcula sp. GCM10025324]|uniref:ATP-binding protein n=1 Tax=Haloarcula TaxID=2237 RepID=UPI0023E7FF1F|nr:ATP-binding protein [Halomicroarcula sp. ZS-22-S1]
MTTESLVRDRFALSGLVVAGLGFFLTRFTVTLAAYDDPTSFVIAGIVPLVLGLALAAFGVALVVGEFERSFVRTVTLWCLAGTTAMFLLVVLTLLGSTGPGGFMSARSQAYLSNFLIGGSVGGALTGVYAANTERQRYELRQEANRSVMVNRLLRDEVLNALTVIRGRVEVARGNEGELTDATLDAIDRRSGDVRTTVENVKHITRGSRSGDGLEAVAVVPCVEQAVESVRRQFPDARYVVETDSAADVTVWANPLLEHVVADLVENAVAYSHSDTPVVEVTLSTDADRVTLDVTDDGPGLPPTQQALIERGEIADYSDRSTGFGLNFVRLLADSYGADVDATVTDDGTTISLALPRADTDTSATDSTDTTYGISWTETAIAVGASLLAGAMMAIPFYVLGGGIPIIGALYGATDAWVAWITHQFHSVVFGLVYAALVAVTPRRHGEYVRYYGVSLAWATALWLVASGVVMPVWLRLVGIDAGLPNLTALAFVGHLLWGLSLALCYRHGRRLFGP